MAYSIEEFSKKIKNKYPEYVNIDDAELVSKIVAKYPEYKNQVDLTQKQNEDLGYFGKIKEAFTSQREKGLSEMGKISEQTQKGELSVPEAIGQQFSASKEAFFSPAVKAAEAIVSPATEAVSKGIGKITDVTVGEEGKQAVANLFSDIAKTGQEKFNQLPENVQGNLKALAQAGEMPLEVAELIGLGSLAGSGKQAVSKIATSQPVVKAREVVATGLEKSAQRNIENVLAPTKEATKAATAKVAPKLVEEKPLALTREGLLEQATKKTQEFGKKIDDYIDEGKLTGSMKTQTVLDDLEKAKSNYKVGNVEVEPESIKVINGLQETISQFGDVIDADSLQQIKKIWSDTVAKGGGYLKTLKEGTELDFKKRVTDLIRSELAKANPDLDVLNKQFSLWKNTENILKETVKRKIGQEGVVKKGFRTIAGMSAAGDVGLIGKLLGATAVRTLGAITESTGWNLVSARLKKKLADAIAVGNVKIAKEAVDEIVRSVKSINTSKVNGLNPFQKEMAITIDREQKAGMIHAEKFITNKEGVLTQGEVKRFLERAKEVKKQIENKELDPKDAIKFSKNLDKAGIMPKFSKKLKEYADTTRIEIEGGALKEIEKDMKNFMSDKDSYVQYLSKRISNLKAKDIEDLTDRKLYTEIEEVANGFDMTGDELFTEARNMSDKRLLSKPSGIKAELQRLKQEVKERKFVKK